MLPLMIAGCKDDAVSAAGAMLHAGAAAIADTGNTVYASAGTAASGFRDATCFAKQFRGCKVASAT
jgi:hypothetical protein